MCLACCRQPNFWFHKPPLMKKRKSNNARSSYHIILPFFHFVVWSLTSRTTVTTCGLPPELRWQSGRLLTDRSLVRSQVVAFYFTFFYFFRPCALSDPLRNVANGRLKYSHTSLHQPCSAEVSSDRTNLSPFTKDYRGLALQCD